MVVKIPKEIAELDENKTLGIDLGLNIPLYASVNTTNESLAIGSRENFLNQRLTLKRRKKDLQRNLRFNTGGRGRKQKMKAQLRKSLIGPVSVGATSRSYSSSV